MPAAVCELEELVQVRAEPPQFGADAGGGLGVVVTERPGLVRPQTRRGGNRGLADERRGRHPAPIGGPLDGARLGVGQPEAELAATKAIGSDARRRRTEWPPLG